MPDTMYRTIHDISADDLLGVLTHDWQHQIDLWKQLGGDPADINYSLLGWRTRALRNRGIAIETSRVHGVRLADTSTHPPQYVEPHCSTCTCGRADA